MTAPSFTTDMFGTDSPLYPHCLAIRQTVFHVEQAIDPARDIDDAESACLHYLFSQHNVPFATCRARLVDDVVKLERFAMLKAYRGQGLAGPCFKAAMDSALEKFGANKIKIGAQAYLQNFYSRLGFQPEGDLFDDANIPHIMMVYKAA